MYKHRKQVWENKIMARLIEAAPEHESIRALRYRKLRGNVIYPKQWTTKEAIKVAS